MQNPMNHIDEQKLELYVVAYDEFDAQDRNAIERHLSECSQCTQALESLRSFYADLEKNLETPPTERDRALARRLIMKKRLAIPERASERKDLSVLETYAEIIEPYKRPMLQRFVRYVQLHPVRFAGAMSLAAAVIGLISFAVQPQKDTNPAYHKILRQVLYVYNKDGEILWTKSARGMQDDSSKFNPMEDNSYTMQAVRVFDIDGDLQNEVVVTSLSAYGEVLLKPYDYARDTLYCFDADGGLRWKQGIGDGAKFGPFDFTKNPDWRIHKVLPVRRSPTERVQLFVLAVTGPLWPTKLMELDPRTGRELQHYWHAGALGAALEADVDGDNVNELVVAGINNYLRGAVIAVFDPLSVRGAGPTIRDISPPEAGKGSEKFYLLLPRTNLAERFSTVPYNMMKVIYVSPQGRIAIHTDETNHPEYFGGLVYGFGDSMRVNYVVANDLFELNFEKARQRGLIKEQLNAAYYETLRKSVRYWDGETFVGNPIMNRYYSRPDNLP